MPAGSKRLCRQPTPVSALSSNDHPGGIDDGEIVWVLNVGDALATIIDADPTTVVAAHTTVTIRTRRRTLPPI
jgi:hypothetical protein